MPTQHKDYTLLAVIFAVLLCGLISYFVYPFRSEWPGVPPAPKVHQALAYGLGDTQFSYRVVTLMLQHRGDIGGRVTSLKDYNYRHVRDWLELSYALDSRANWAPSLAAYYFSATQRKSDIKYLVDYLAKVGNTPTEGQERWRWLAHAVYLSRFVLNDQERALRFAQDLSNNATPDMPIWTKHMPAYVISNVGQKKAARDLILTIMATDKSLIQADINQSCWYLDNRLREPNDGLEYNPVYQAMCQPIK